MLHPLSPRGKLVHLGLEGLASTNKLLDTALQYEGETILRNEIYRVALNDEHVSTLKRTGKELPDLTQWKEPEELPWANSEILGSLRLHSGCKVVHVPTYLKGLWAACQSMGSGEKEWLVDADCTSPEYDWEHCLSSFDTVVLCAGAGLFQNSIIKDRMPMQLVRGQSVELSLGEKSFEHAMLCGKYVSPLVEKNRVLVGKFLSSFFLDLQVLALRGGLSLINSYAMLTAGATHEFKEEPFDASQVKEELKERSYPFSSSIWDDGIVDKITCGFRVQSNRGKYGRIPIIGHFDTPIHANAWVFTGLSSRGLLYHGIYGNMLTDMILNLEEENQVEHVHLDWWRE